MNIPNFLTLVRIILVPVIVIFLIQERYLNALIALSVSGATDVLDGFLARQLNMQTRLGAYMDPIADKALVASCFVTLAITGMMPAWLAVIVISRDVIILLSVVFFFIMSISFQIKPALVSKATTVVQIVTILLVLLVKSFAWNYLDPLVWLLYWLTAFFTVVSGLYYLIRGVRMISLSA